MPQADLVKLVEELNDLWRAAGRPSYRRISAEIRDRDDLPDTVSHETVGNLLNGISVPRWSKVESVVRVWAAKAIHRPDVEAEVQRFHGLWAAADDMSRTETTNPDHGVTPIANSATPGTFIPETSGPPGPQIGSVPPRNRSFTGRDDILRVIRAKLEGEPWQPLVLHGLSGAGKTSVAMEYVYRAQSRYDFVWWIMAEQISQVRSALVTLGERRDWHVSQDMQQTISSVLARLESPDFRWLIVFDNAAGPEQIGPLLPAAGGDVIVTSRDATWLDRGRAVPVEVLPRKHSIELLRRRGGISFDEADQLAERLGDLPLALEQAAAMRAATGISVTDYLDRLDRQATVVLNQGRPNDYEETVAGAFGVTFTQLRRESTGAAQLLALLSCLSAEPVSVALLRAADESTIPPPLGRLLGQEAQLQDAVRLLRRFGLITSVEDGQRMQVHRLVQLIVRDSLTDHELQQAYTNARRLLAAVNPGRPDETITWEMHTQIGPHVRPAKLVEDTTLEVRQVVLDQARYLYTRGDYDGSLTLSEEARRAWAGPDDVWNDEQTYACVDRIANALVGLGRYKEAGDLYERAWIQLTEAEHPFGPDHPRTVRMANGVARSRRILGRYSEALELEKFRVKHYELRSDPDSPDLMHARNNLAASLRTIGDFVQAREIDESLVEARTRLGGESDYLTLFSISNLARDLYGLGDYAGALQLQQQWLPALRERLNKRHQFVILAGRTVVLGLRKVGRLAEALEQSRDHFHVSSGEFSSDHGITLAAAMTYANTIRAAVSADQGDQQASYLYAYNLCIDTVNRYRRRFGERNPLTLVAATNQAIIMRAMGERIRARNIAEPAYHVLYDQLGADHPSTQAAAVGLANDLVAAHEEDEAARLLRSTLETARGAGRQSHPDMLVCAVNLDLITQESDPEGDDTLVASNLAALTSVLGPDHPQVRAAGRGERGECDIEPPPF